MADKVELFNGKCGLIEGCIQRIGRSRLDFVVLEDPKLLLHYYTQWHVYASFDKYRKCSVVSKNSPYLLRSLVVACYHLFDLAQYVLTLKCISVYSRN